MLGNKNCAAFFPQNQNSSFVETLHSPAMITYLKLGLEAWQTPAYVSAMLCFVVHGGQVKHCA